MEYRVFAPEGIPAITQGDDLAAVLATAFRPFCLQNGDIVLVAHKVVSKAEGRMVRLEDVQPSAKAHACAAQTKKDPRLVELILRQSREVLCCGKNGPLLCVEKNNFVCADAGVDCSNTAPGCALLLPKNPDESAQKLRTRLEEAFGVRLGVLICDTHGRAFRTGACGVVIGGSGVRLCNPYIGQPDLQGRIMQSSVEGIGDELAAAATLAMGQGNEGRPAACVRGLAHFLGEGKAEELQRPQAEDLFLQAMRRCREAAEGKG